MENNKSEYEQDILEEEKNKVVDKNKKTGSIYLKRLNWKKVFNKKMLITFLGLSIIFFSFVGVVVTAKNLYVSIVRVFNNSAEKEEFERYILPVLMFDPVPFDDAKKADKFSLLRSAIWAAFINNSKEKYLNEDYNSFVIPVSDVDVNLAMLYGNKIKIEHQTFGDEFMNNYVYDKETMTYMVPLYDQVGIYSPKVKNIYKKNDIYTLTVGYIRPDSIWQTYIEEKKGKPRPEKYMEYVLKKVGKNYNIISIKDSPLDDNLLKDYGFEE